MMHPDPIVLTRQEHVDHINRHWNDDLDLTAVRREARAHAVRLRWIMLATNFAAWGAIVVIGLEIFRP